MDLLKFCKDLYPIYRSITGRGNEESLKYIQSYIPLEIKKIKSGSEVFDWTVPPEWNIRDAFVKNVNSNIKVIDFCSHNLHIVGYSEPVDQVLSFYELEAHLFYLSDQPEAIPFITSYYSKTWGFCLSYETFLALDKNLLYHIYIDSEFNDNGHLVYGELLLQGREENELFFSANICHPQMANNELSGPAVLTGLAEYVLEKKYINYSYRFILIPETIGAIVYLSENLRQMKKNIIGGFNIACVGDERDWGLIAARAEKNYSQDIATYVLDTYTESYTRYSWLDRGSDERQYCAPGIDLPISAIVRSKFGEFIEYHTSLDNFSVVTQKGLTDSLEMYKKCIDIFETNTYPLINVSGEPQMGKRGLYPSLSTNATQDIVKDMMNFISYCDGKHSILQIAILIQADYFFCLEICEKLKSSDLLVNRFNQKLFKPGSVFSPFIPVQT